LHCANHPDVPTVGTCRECRLTYCADCLVYVFGEGRTPFCVDCALANSRRASVRRARSEAPTIAPTAPVAEFG
jgi:hypothetical protein